MSSRSGWKCRRPSSTPPRSLLDHSLVTWYSYDPLSRRNAQSRDQLKAMVRPFARIGVPHDISYAIRRRSVDVSCASMVALVFQEKPLATRIGIIAAGSMRCRINLPTQAKRKGECRHDAPLILRENGCFVENWCRRRGDAHAHDECLVRQDGLRARK